MAGPTGDCTGVGVRGGRAKGSDGRQEAGWTTESRMDDRKRAARLVCHTSPKPRAPSGARHMGRGVR